MRFLDQMPHTNSPLPVIICVFLFIFFRAASTNAEGGQEQEAADDNENSISEGGAHRHRHSHSHVHQESCEFSLQRVPGLWPIVKRDSKGRECRLEMALPFCKGRCKTRESGVHTFPYREQDSQVCALIGREVENVTMTDCDEGVDASIRVIQVAKSRECGCQRLQQLNSQVQQTQQPQLQQP